MLFCLSILLPRKNSHAPMSRVLSCKLFIASREGQLVQSSTLWKGAPQQSVAGDALYPERAMALLVGSRRDRLRGTGERGVEKTYHLL